MCVSIPFGIVAKNCVCGSGFSGSDLCTPGGRGNSAVFTVRNPIQNECMAAVFERTAELEEEILVISNVISEFVYVQLSVYEQEESLVAGMVGDLLKHPGVQYHHGFFPNPSESLEMP